ncbi:hypothetical protein SAE02_72700 [Skermanella aerolata]|uniref:Uncharacterized protein n=2 Tax=Skermanella aerolata TaxID=393310 RepID=A0A512E320_9PROT|nr:hypothetical protein SAE02_72700 [Skermanella aerolata]
MDFLAGHPWEFLLLFFVLCAAIIGVEVRFNRENWKQRSSELIVNFFGVFVAIVFALAQGKYDRDEEGRDKVMALLRATELELYTSKSENDIPIVGMEELEKSTRGLNPEVVAATKSLIKRYNNASKKVDASNRLLYLPIFNELVKEPEVISRFPPQISLLLSLDYQKLQLMQAMMNDQERTDRLINSYGAPENIEKNLDAFEEAIRPVMKTALIQQLSTTKYALCALRTSIEVREEFTEERDDADLWVARLKKSCGNGDGLVLIKPGRPYVEGLVDYLKHGPA